METVGCLGRIVVGRGRASLVNNGEAKASARCNTTLASKSTMGVSTLAVHDTSCTGGWPILTISMLPVGTKNRGSSP
jgi:hypothetical protein